MSSQAVVPEILSASQPHILMVGSHPEIQGGIGSVVKTYGQHGFLANKTYLVSHDDGSHLYRIWLFSRCLIIFSAMLVFKPSLRIVHLHMSERGSFYRKGILIALCLAFGKKVAIHLHGAEFMVFYEHGSRLQKTLIKAVLDNVHLIVVLSKSWQENIRRLTNNPNIQVIYNPVHVRKDVAAAHRKMEEPLRLVFLGRLGKRKGVYDLLEAMALVRDNNITLDLYGDGEIEYTKDLIASLDIGHCVNVKGWISGREKQDVLLSADALVLPSYNEGLPVAILEAMAAGLAVISTPVGGIQEAVFHRENGLIVEAGDVLGLKDAILTLYTDIELLNRCKQRSRELCSELFHYELIFDKLNRGYQALCG